MCIYTLATMWCGSQKTSGLNCFSFNTMEFWDNSGCQAWWQVPLFYRPPFLIINIMYVHYICISNACGGQRTPDLLPCSVVNKHLYPKSSLWHRVSGYVCMWCVCVCVVCACMYTGVWVWYVCVGVVCTYAFMHIWGTGELSGVTFLRHVLCFRIELMSVFGHIYLLCYLYGPRFLSL